MYHMLKTKQFKLVRNQMLHLKDSEGVTYCQTENMKRGKPPEFIEFVETDDRPVCKICVGIRDYREYREPSLAVLMGERADDTPEQAER